MTIPPGTPRFRPLLCLLPLALLQGQSVRLEPSLGVAEQEYRQAQETWLHEDPGLTADLLTGNPADLHKRIRRVAGLRDDVMEKKGVYLDLIIKRFADMRSRLTGSGVSQLPIAELRKGLDEEQSLLLGDQERLEALIRDLPQGDEYSLVMRELNAEKTQLINLQNAVAMRKRAVDQMDEAQKVGKEIEEKDPIAAKLDAIAAIWSQEKEQTKQQRAKWADLYATMDREVDRGKAPVQKDPAPAQRPPGSKTEKKPAPPLANAAPPPAPPAGFAGTWIYESRPGAWTGFGEPVRAALELHRAGTRISGEYTARVPGRSDMRNLNLTLVGEETEPGLAKLAWSSQVPPAHGEMVLKMGSDRRVLLERTSSDDTYVPRGMEVLLPR